MTAELQKDFVIFLAYLLPGFLAAWVYYGLTSHSKPSQFERIVEALIFTLVIQTISPVVQGAALWVGRWMPIRHWDTLASGLVSLGLAVIAGTLAAYFSNSDAFHRWLRARGFTTRTSHPSEWYSVLARKEAFVILHFKDGRRLYGWPKEWPVESDRGQFYIMLPSWIAEDGSSIELPQLDGILVRVEDVQWVEFLATDSNHHDQS